MPCKGNRNLLFSTQRMARIFAISDLHVDISENRKLVERWSQNDYQNDVLIVAGDVTDNISLLETVLKFLARKFFKVCFVPGNHDLWIRPSKDNICHADSIAKFHAITALCDTIGVHTKPLKVHCCNSTSVWIVPLFSWYTQPDENPRDSLFVSGASEDPEFSEQVWMDNRLCKWPALRGTASQYFADLNGVFVENVYDSPVISFSHFLPRVDLISASDEDMKRVEEERKRLRLASLQNPRAQGSDLRFNFTRFAGCKAIERQIRKLGSKVHVHGHQHRNRDRVVEGVRYVSFCLGYPRERSMGVIWGLPEGGKPRQIWP